MSRDLLVIGAFAVICIMISPFFKESKLKTLKNTVNDNPDQGPPPLLRTNFLTQKMPPLNRKIPKKLYCLVTHFCQGRLQDRKFPPMKL